MSERECVGHLEPFYLNGTSVPTTSFMRSRKRWPACSLVSNFVHVVWITSLAIQNITIVSFCLLFIARVGYCRNSTRHNKPFSERLLRSSFVDTYAFILNISNHLAHKMGRAELRERPVTEYFGLRSYTARQSSST